jgi:hypothetical protein
MKYLNLLNYNGNNKRWKEKKYRYRYYRAQDTATIELLKDWKESTRKY